MPLTNFEKREDYKNLDQLIGKILASSQNFPSQFILKMKEIKKRNQFKLIESFEKEEKSEIKIAQNYEKFFLKNKSNELGLLDSYNTAIRYEQGKEYNKAIDFYNIFTRSYKKIKIPVKEKKIYRDLQRNAIKSRALIYKEISQYKKAADDFNSYARQYPRDVESSNFLFDSAFIYKELSRYNSALSNFNLYLGRNKKNKKVKEVLYFIGKIWEKRKKYTKALVFYDRYFTTNT